MKDRIFLWQCMWIFGPVSAARSWMTRISTGLPHTSSPPLSPWLLPYSPAAQSSDVWEFHLLLKSLLYCVVQFNICVGVIPKKVWCVVHLKVSVEVECLGFNGKVSVVVFQWKVWGESYVYASQAEVVLSQWKVWVVWLSEDFGTKGGEESERWRQKVERKPKVFKLVRWDLLVTPGTACC